MQERTHMKTFLSTRHLRCCAVALIGLLLFAPLACTGQEMTHFPRVPEHFRTVDQTIDPTIFPSDDTAMLPEARLTLAVPFAVETVDALVRLYTIKKSETYEPDIIITPDMLAAATPVFEAQVIQTPMTGASYSAIFQWRVNEIPIDLIYTDRVEQLAERNMILPISDWVAGQKSLLPDRIYSHLLDAGYVDGILYALPFLASTKVIYINKDIFAACETDLINPWFSLAELDAASAQIAEAGDLGVTTPYTPFYNAMELIYYLPAKYDANYGWLTYTDHTFYPRSEAFSESTLYLRWYLAQGFSADARVLGQDDQQWDGDPRLAGQIAMWLDDTSQSAMYASSLSYDLTLAFLPDVAVTENPGPQPLSVYPLCIASGSANPQLAADFAVFMATDKDALRLLSDYESLDGMLPCIDDLSVWAALVEPQQHGPILMQMYDVMDEAYVILTVNSETYYDMGREVIYNHRQDLFGGGRDLVDVLGILSDQLR